jgi:hypothetical protein
LNEIISSDEKIGNIEYMKINRIRNNNSLKLRTPTVYDDCVDYYNPVGWDCRERRIKGFLSEINISPTYGGNSLSISFEQEYWCETSRGVWPGWLANDVDYLSMEGEIDFDVIIFVYFTDGSWHTYYNYISFSVDHGGTDVDELESSNQEIVQRNFHKTIQWIEVDIDTGGNWSADDDIYYYMIEKLGSTCDNEVVEVDCTIHYE